MDDRTWYIAIATLAMSTVVVMFASIASVDLEPTFWTVPTAVFGWLGARSVFKNGKGNGNGTGNT